MKKTIFKILLSLALFLPACAGPSIFPNISLSTSNPVLAQPIFMAIDETRNRGYLINSNNLVNYADASLMVLDLSNPTAPVAINVVALANFSGQAYLDTTNQYLYIANRLSANVDDAVDQIIQVNVNESSPQYLNMVQYSTDGNPFGITSDGTNLYIACTCSADLIPLSNLNIRTNVSFNVQNNLGVTLNTSGTRELALSPSGQYLFVTNNTAQMLILNVNQIAIPDPSLQVTQGGSAAVDYDLANTLSTRGIVSDSNYIYVVDGSTPALKILTEQNLPINTTATPIEIPISQLAVAEIPLNTNPNEIALDTINGRVYTTIAGTMSNGNMGTASLNEVSVVDTTTLTQIAQISLTNNLPAGVAAANNPFGISVGHFGGVPYIYVLNLNSNNISIINGNTLSVVASFP